MGGNYSYHLYYALLALFWRNNFQLNYIEGKMKTKKRKFFMSSYLFSVAIFLLVLLYGVHIIILWSTHTFPPEKEYWYIFGSLTAIETFLLFWQYEIFGTVKIQDDGVLFSSPLRGKRKFLYSEIGYVGIDYGVISGGIKQFWIVFSLDNKIPAEYCHNINRMKMTGRTMRLQYNRKVFDALVYYLPKDLSKKLNASYSVIRLFNAETE